jgi:hypothetical protein
LWNGVNTLGPPVEEMAAKLGQLLARFRKGRFFISATREALSNV